MKIDALGRRCWWSADDVVELERLVRLGLNTDQIGALVDPPVTGRTIVLAAKRIGIKLGPVGRPKSAERARRERVFARELARKATGK